MDDSDIVEIYSAANSIEAYAMANALKAAGIKARVVGDILGMAAGGLAVGVPIAPQGLGPQGRRSTRPGTA